MKKAVFIFAAAIGFASCSKDQLDQTNPSVIKKSGTPSSPAVMLPENETEVVAAVQSFFDAYNEYTAETYNTSNSPDYQVGYGAALLEAAFNAHHATTEAMANEGYYATYDSASTMMLEHTATFDDQGIVLVSELDLLQSFESLLVAYANVQDIAPVSDITILGEVSPEGFFSMKFTLSKLVGHLGQTGIGSGEFRAHIKTDCNGNGFHNAADRISMAIGTPALAYPWFYNVTKYHCKEANGTTSQGAWDYNVYYVGTDGLGKPWKYSPNINLQGYQSNFLGGECWTSLSSNCWGAYDCVTNTQMQDFRDGAQAVLDDFQTYVRSSYLQHRVYSTNKNASSLGVPKVYHSMEWLSPAGAMLTPAL